MKKSARKRIEKTLDLPSSTIVVFRRWRVSGAVIALFPFELCDLEGNCTSYAHVGQHAAADYDHVIASTTACSPSTLGVMKLVSELVGLGYKLDARLHSKALGLASQRARCEELRDQAGPERSELVPAR